MNYEIMNYETMSIMSKEDLISIIKTLEVIRSNYEEKFGIIMYANGEIKKIEA